MTNYILRRLVVNLFTLFFVTFLLYALIRHIPGTPLTMDLAMSQDAGRKMSQEHQDILMKAYGLDKPFVVAYWHWIGGIVRGDFGTSFNFKKPVARVIMDRAGPTLVLSITSLLLVYLISIPIGLYSSVRAGRADERIISTILYMLYSFPTFVAALLLQIGLAVKLNILPLFGMRSIDFQELSGWGQFLDLAKHAALPLICYTYGALAFDSRFIRSNMMEVLRQDYIRTARAKGVSEPKVIVRHAFRNTLIPFVTLLGLSLPGLLGGSIILEQIFSWPGMGKLFFESLTARDYPVLMALFLIYSVLTLLGNLLADVLYAFVDPRISYS